MESLIYSKDLTIISVEQEYYESSTATPDYHKKTELHVPFFGWIIILFTVLFIGMRIIKEIIIRLRA